MGKPHASMGELSLFFFNSRTASSLPADVSKRTWVLHQGGCKHTWYQRHEATSDVSMGKSRMRVLGVYSWRGHCPILLRDISWLYKKNTLELFTFGPQFWRDGSETAPLSHPKIFLPLCHFVFQVSLSCLPIFAIGLAWTVLRLVCISLCLHFLSLVD